MVLWGKKEEAMFELLHFLLALITPDQKVLLDRFLKERRDENDK